MPAPHRSAFTLVELLVVVAIIVVLLALLSPALDRAVTSAEATVCASTLRNWGQGMFQYAQDHKGSVVQMEWARGEYWCHRLAPYMGQPGWGKGPQAFDPPLKANLCPSVKVTPDDSGSDWLTNGPPYGTADKTWTTVQTHGAYAWNGALSKYSQNSNYESWRTVEFYSRYLNAPGTTPVMGDGVWGELYPVNHDETGTYDKRPSSTYSGDGAGPGLGRVCIDRHDLAINLVFVDCSSRTVPLGDLWTLEWHGRFDTTTAYQGTFTRQ